MRQLPNTLSALRLLGAIALLFCDVKGIAFWSVYLFCGISDMLDGFLARKLNAATPFGAVLDSVADLCFVVCCCCKLIPVLEFPLWMWIWCGMIAIIKLMNQASWNTIGFIHGIDSSCHYRSHCCNLCGNSGRTPYPNKKSKLMSPFGL